MTGLDEERRAALADAARAAGVPARLVQDAVLAYLGEAVDAERNLQMRQLRDRHFREAALFERAALAMSPGPCARSQLDGVTAPVRPDPDEVRFALHEEARRRRIAAARIDPSDRRQVSLRPGSPQWRLLWRLLELWVGAGGRLGVGPSSRFLAFAGDVLASVGETPSERVAAEVVKRWRSETARAQETPLVSSAA